MGKRSCLYNRAEPERMLGWAMGRGVRKRRFYLCVR